jgi:26S proteasome regulatory subunit T5
MQLICAVLLQMFIGDGAKLVRDAFALAKEKSPCIIFIDEIDAIGTKRFDSELSGDREVQRTMLELLNQLDGFSSDENIKVCAWTYIGQGWRQELRVIARSLLHMQAVCVYVWDCCSTNL